MIEIAETGMDDGAPYGFVLRYALRDEVCEWVERQENPADYGISCAFQQRQVETLTQGWLQVDTTETPSLLVWCDDASAAEAFTVTFGAHVKDVVARPQDRPAAYH
jgi:hypothetical protein